MISFTFDFKESMLLYIYVYDESTKLGFEKN